MSKDFLIVFDENRLKSSSEGYRNVVTFEGFLSLIKLTLRSRDTKSVISSQVFVQINLHLKELYCFKYVRLRNCKVFLQKKFKELLGERGLLNF